MLGFLFIAVLGISGCGPGDPLGDTVKAEDPLSFSMWRSHAAAGMSPEQIADFDEAVQAIRIRIMSVGNTTGSEWIEAETLKFVNGKTVREVLGTGLSWKLELTVAEREVLEDSLRKNALMRTRPGDTESARYLADLHDRQASRLEAAMREEAQIRSRLAASGLPADPRRRLPANGP